MLMLSKVYEFAVDHYGMITAEQAKTLGISSKWLANMSHRGRLNHIGYGVYQIQQYVPTERDPYAQAVALAGPGAFLYGESVLALLNLTATNPTRIYLGTSGRMRRTLGPGYRVHRHLRRDHVTQIEGIDSQEVPEAILAARPTVRGDRLVAATEEAFRRGIINDEARTRLINLLEKNENA